MLSRKQLANNVFAFRSRCAFTLAVTGDELSDAHLFTFGEWQGHPNGEFEFTEEIARKLIANFEAQANPVPFTYEHDSQPGNPRPASGWVYSLEVRDNGLWAKVKWTNRAREMIREGEYQFCSVVVDFESTDRKSGEAIGPELLEVGLTNTPFVDGQVPLAASRSLSNEVNKMADDIVKEEVKSEVKLEDDSTEAAAAMVLTKLLEATGLDEAGLVAALESKLEEVASILSAPAGDIDSEAISASAKVDEEEMKKLSRENAQLKEQLVTQEVARAVELGHVPAGQRDTLIKLGRTDLAAARALIEGGKKSAKAPPTGTVYKASRTAEVEARDDDEKRFLDGLPKHVTGEKRAVFLSRFREKRAQ